MPYITMNRDKSLYLAPCNIYRMEQNVDRIVLSVPRYYGTSDLLACDAFLCIQGKERSEYAPLAAPTEETDGTLTYSYPITTAITGQSGSAALWFEWSGEGETLKSGKCTLSVQDRPDADALLTEREKSYLAAWRQDMERYTAEHAQFVSDLASGVFRGEKGEKGDTGAPGHTPVKGVDYFTAADRAALVADLIVALPDASEVSY